MTPTKPRIYDLARVFSSSEADEKIRKQKQSDLTKEIILICKDLGFPDKTSSSSIDESMIDKIVTSLKEHGLNIQLNEITSELKKEGASEKKLKKTQEKVQVEVPEPQPVKKQIKIVRRIKPPPKEEPPSAVSLPISGVLPEQKPKEIIKPQPGIVSQPVNQSSSMATKPVQEKPVPKVELSSKVELAPKVQLPSKVQLPLQPFRVAKPTMVPSMMGRTKRPSAGRASQQHRVKEKKEIEPVIIAGKPASVILTRPLTVKELSEKLSLPETEVVKNLFSKGIIRTVNQMLELDQAIGCAQALGYEVITKEEEKENSLQADISQEKEIDLVSRPPVVTIMGHVDHGKTSLLDAIRETKLKLIDQEAGGITQHIGAYQVDVVDYDGNKKLITFLDTPGHEAFTAMRARGAQVTDIAILVVAADDGIKPQTIEAIDHAKAAGVPIIVAVNKIDKPEAQPDRVIGQLTEYDLLPEEYGGKTVCSKISAKKRINLDDLLTKITLVADAELTQKLRANPKALATGAVIEAQLSKEKGPIAHILIQNGTLKKGDCIVAGKVAGRVRAMFDDHGKEVEKALPAMPVEIIGLPDVPQAGDTFQVYKSYQEAKEIALERQLKEKESRRSFGLVDFALKVKEGQVQELKIIIKTDVHGSSEAVTKEIVNLSTKDILVRPIHIGTGNISESDINLASSTGAIVIGFHVSVDQNAGKIAQEQGVDVRIYDIIYKITEDLEKALLGLLEPEKQEVKLGFAEIRQIYTFGKGNKIAGSYVIEGKIQRNQIARVTRTGKLLYEGKLTGLKRFKDDAREVQTGFECGISFESYNDLEVGDIIECWTIIEKERTSLT